MLRIILGIILMVGAFVILFMFIQGPEENTFVGETMTSIFCREGEHFVQVLGPYVDNFGSDNDGQSVNFYCENERERRRDVTGETALSFIGAFSAPFVLGLLMFIWGTSSMAWKAARGITSAAMNSYGGVVQGQPSTYYTNTTQPFGNTSTTSTTFMTADGKPVDPNQIPPEKMQQIQDVFKAMGMNAPQMGSSMMGASTPTSGADFVSQLKQLEDARVQNLITQEEYDRLRKDILDRMA